MSPTPPQIFTSHSEQETAQLARQVATALRGGEYISLEGDLGAGKTLFSRELARALGITESVTSPTFVIQKVYPIPANSGHLSHLVHYDFYRISDYHELIDLGFEDHDSSTIVLAEWGNLYVDYFPVSPVRIHIEIRPRDVRLISISGISLNL
jgi:tRNA threonylcarbamoyladenosine biosynthesis protein TsaE